MFNIFKRKVKEIVEFHCPGCNGFVFRCEWDKIKKFTKTLKGTAYMSFECEKCSDRICRLMDAYRKNNTDEVLDLINISENSIGR
jgi:predicted RNA-binding Zn-ribbon protein involved in translation (DUF1610 family)